MSSPFESYDDLEDADERLQAADPGERRVAIIALGGTISAPRMRLLNAAVDKSGESPPLVAARFLAEQAAKH